MKKILILLSVLLCGFYLTSAVSIDLSSGSKLASSNWQEINNITSKINLSSNNLNISGKLVSSGKICTGNTCLGECEDGYIWDSSTTSCIIDYSTISQKQKIQSSDLAAGDNFGYTVNISGDGNTVIIGANMQDNGGTNAGSAYIFIKSGNIWIQQAKLEASDKEANDRFGISTSINYDGNTAIIGSFGEATGGANIGSAYVFTRSGNNWSQQAKIQASDKQVEDRFGFSVDLSDDGDTAVVGSAWEDTGGTDAGKAYIFTRSGNVRSEQDNIQASDKQSEDYFGRTVALSGDGNYAIVGAPQKAGGGKEGKAYIFIKSGNTWTQQSKIQSNDIHHWDMFGIHVSIDGDGDTVAVGAIRDETTAVETGSIYVFTRTGTTWSQEAKLVASDREFEDRLGTGVNITSDGNTVIGGAFLEDPSDLVNAGSVYVFTRNGTNWSQKNKFIASDKEAEDRFGTSSSISGDGKTIIVGAYLEDTLETNSGAIYVFE